MTTHHDPGDEERCHLPWCHEPPIVLWMPPTSLTHLEREWKPTCEPHSRGIRRVGIGKFMPIFTTTNPKP